LFLFVKHNSIRLKILLLLCNIWLSIGMPGCARESAVEHAADSGSESKTEDASSVVWFRERTEITGLEGYHVSSESRFEMPGIMGSGCSLIDLNNDGRLDVVLVPGDPDTLQDTSEPSKTRPANLCRVLMQEQDSTFRDETTRAALSVAGFGMGCYGGDLDNDGDSDVLTTSSAGVRVHRNQGELQFVDVTDSCGIQSNHWSTAAVMFDYNQDGWLDVLVVNYVDYFPGTICQDGAGRRDYCGPLSFSGTSDQLFRNRGSDGEPGKFEEVSIASGIATGIGKGLGAICSDFSGDGRPDIYVANDMEPNFLWIQNAERRFENQADLRGCAVDLQGRPQASMGTVLADLNSDNRQDIFLTHLRGETNTLYLQVENGTFLDQTASSGLGEASRNFTGFGVVARDFDLNGEPDLAIVNGRVMRAPMLREEANVTQWNEYAEKNQLFRRLPNGQFVTIGSQDPFLAPVEVSRGLAAGDLDNDGDIDLLVTSVSAPARVYENVAARQGHWLQVRAINAAWKRDAFGARITVSVKGRQWTAEVQPHIGYLASQDPRVHFGLGSHTQYEFIDVQWPDSPDQTERFPAGSADRQVVVKKGSGITVPRPSSGVSLP